MSWPTYHLRADAFSAEKRKKCSMFIPKGASIAVLMVPVSLSALRACANVIVYPPSGSVVGFFFAGFGQVGYVLMLYSP